MGTRTTTSGSGADFRFTSGQPDGLNDPAGGFNPGLPPMVWITGGSIAANSNPSGIGATRLLDALTDGARGYTVAQCNAPALIGNPTSTGRIDDAIAWLRANRGAVGPPIVWGISNGWVCSIIYARRKAFTAAAVLGVGGILTPTDAYDAWIDNQFGLRATVDAAWGSTYPTISPTDLGHPEWDPNTDVENYDKVGLRDRGHMWLCPGDFLYGEQQMQFGALLGLGMTNVGPYGHLGTFTAPAAAVDHVVAADFVAFFDSLWTP